MYWLNPWAWLGVLSVALPVLVHLYSRRPPREAPFPSLRFLEASRLLPTRRTRISDVPLLLVRLLILALAVAALAQPFWPSAAPSSSTEIGRAVIVDTLSSVGNTAAAAALERLAAAEIGNDGASLRINTDAPHAVLAGAAEWVQRQPGRHELIVISDFRSGSIDSLDLTQLPRDLSVRLIRTTGSDANAVSMRSLGRVQWFSGGEASVVAAVRRAARVSGASALDSVDGGSADSLTRTVLVVSPGADSASFWIRRARPLNLAWMGDVVSALAHDTSLVTSAWATRSADTILVAPFAALLRTASQAPLVMVAALPGTDGPSRLLLISRAPVDALTTVTLLWSASRALEPMRTVTAGPVITDEQLRQWERAPAAEARVNRTSLDPDAGPSHGRWLWIGVLVLLGIEAIVRHRLSVTSSPAAA